MARKTLTHAQATTQAYEAQQGLVHLRLALECFKRSDNKKTAGRVQLAISSAKGAVRICSYRQGRAERNA